MSTYCTKTATRSTLPTLAEMRRDCLADAAYFRAECDSFADWAREERTAGEHGTADGLAICATDMLDEAHDRLAQAEMLARLQSPLTRARFEAASRKPRTFIPAAFAPRAR